MESDSEQSICLQQRLTMNIGPSGWILVRNYLEEDGHNSVPCCWLPQRAGHPHPHPPHLDDCVQLTLPSSCCPCRCQRRVQGGPILGQRGSHSENSQVKSGPLYLVLSPEQQTACRSEGAEVVFRRRVQWRHCRYLPPATRCHRPPPAPPTLS